MKSNKMNAEVAPVKAGNKTKVLFRMFNGEVIALFPQVAATIGTPWHCQSYAHVGQHGPADCREVMRASRPAKPGEYRDLAIELRRIGYHLQIVKRCTAADTACRSKQLES